MFPPDTLLDLTTDIQAALLKITAPEIQELIQKEAGFIKGLTWKTKPFTAGGLRMRYETQTPHNGSQMGVTTGATEVPGVIQSFGFTDLVYKRAHVFDTFVPAVISEQIEDYIHDAGATQGGMENAAALLLQATLRNYAFLRSISMVAGRDNILGTITAKGSATDNSSVTRGAYTGRYDFNLEVGGDAIMEAFEIGQLLSACVKPTNYGGAYQTATGAAVGNVRNYDQDDGDGADVASPIEVRDHPVPHKQRGAAAANTGDEDLLTLPCCIWYTDSTHKSAVAAVISAITAGAIGTGDVLTPYSRKLAATNSAKVDGANFGIQGLLHMFSDFNIETATGACSTALATDAGTSISRAAAGNFAFWKPHLVDMAWAKPTFDNIESLFIALSFRAKKDVYPLCLMNPLRFQQLRDDAGTAAYRIQEGLSDALKARFAKYGAEMVVWQGIGAERPMVFAKTSWIPPDFIGFLDPGDLTVLQPKAPEWKKKGGGIWHDRPASTVGTILMSYLAYFGGGMQMHWDKGWTSAGLLRCGW